MYKHTNCCHRCIQSVKLMWKNKNNNKWKKMDDNNVKIQPKKSSISTIQTFYIVRTKIFIACVRSDSKPDSNTHDCELHGRVLFNWCTLTKLMWIRERIECVVRLQLSGRDFYKWHFRDFVCRYRLVVYSIKQWH